MTIVTLLKSMYEALPEPLYLYRSQCELTICHIPMLWCEIATYKLGIFPKKLNVTRSLRTSSPSMSELPGHICRRSELANSAASLIPGQATSGV